MAVTPADKHQGAKKTGVYHFFGFQYRRMKAVVETYFDAYVFFVRRAGYGLQLRSFSRSGFFQHDMLARFDRFQRDGGKLIMRGGNDHNIRVGCQHISPVHGGSAPET